MLQNFQRGEKATDLSLYLRIWCINITWRLSLSFTVTTSGLKTNLQRLVGSRFEADNLLHTRVAADLRSINVCFCHPDSDLLRGSNASLLLGRFIFFVDCDFIFSTCKDEKDWAYKLSRRNTLWHAVVSFQVPIQGDSFSLLFVLILIEWELIALLILFPIENGNWQRKGEMILQRHLVMSIASVNWVRWSCF